MPLNKYLLHGPLGTCWHLLPTCPPLPPIQKRDAKHKFLQQKVAHTDNGATCQCTVPEICLMLVLDDAVLNGLATDVPCCSTRPPIPFSEEGTLLGTAFKVQTTFRRQGRK